MLNRPHTEFVQSQMLPWRPLLPLELNHLQDILWQPLHGY